MKKLILVTVATLSIFFLVSIIQRLAIILCGNMLHWSMFWPIS